MNRFRLWAIKHKFLTGIFSVLIIGYLIYSPPFKPVDPSSPYFMESWFRLRDYASYEGIRLLQNKVLPKFLPIGTPKEYVDLMLINRGGAEIIDKTNFAKGNYAYKYRPLNMILTPDAFFIDVYYDEDNKIEAVWFSGKAVVNPDYKTQLIGKKK